MDEQWDKVEDKYAVTSLTVTGAVALWGSTGMISVSLFFSSFFPNHYLNLLVDSLLKPEIVNWILRN